MVVGLVGAIVALMAGMGFLAALLVYSGIGILGLGCGIAVVALMPRIEPQTNSENQSI